ncbi:MAG: alpha/beta fold hydrolase [Saprospiraceae bacterium]|nr:alpha/beta fold hydrolase [Saprospiraceae bacterium]|tara:strand:- start:22 stop:783 length:762 start_codon:yes stop_codon:yes gene_type:complete
MKLNHKILGEGTPIVILHGLFGMLDNWMTFGKALAEKYKVILVDHRNHGKSPHSDEISFELYAQDLKELIDDLNIPRAYVLGHSMGGKTAMYFATRYPKSTLGIISVDIGAHGYYKGNHDEIFDAILPIDLNKYGRRGEIDDALSTKISILPTRQFLLKNLSRTDSSYKWKANFQVLHDQYDEIRKAVPEGSLYKGPSLIIRGGNSPYVRIQDMEYIQSIFPAVLLETVENAGHWVHAEKPKELLGIVHDFLE